MKNELILNGNKYRLVAAPKNKNNPRSNPDVQAPYMQQQMLPAQWGPSQSQIVPVTWANMNPQRKLRKPRKNPADAATFVLVTALAVFVWYMYSNGMLTNPFGKSTVGTDKPKTDTGNNTGGSSGSTPTGSGNNTTKTAKNSELDNIYSDRRNNVSSATSVRIKDITLLDYN